MIKLLKCKFTKVPTDAEQELPNTKLQRLTDGEGEREEGRDRAGERESKRTIRRRGRGRGSVTGAEGGRRRTAPADPSRAANPGMRGGP